MDQIRDRDGYHVPRHLADEVALYMQELQKL
jgi:hypothetical protein